MIDPVVPGATQEAANVGGSRSIVVPASFGSIGGPGGGPSDASAEQRIVVPASFDTFDGPGGPNDANVPQWVLDLEGSTISGGAIVGGQGDVPIHGGLGPGQIYASGLREGWGADQNAPMPESLSSWIDPRSVGNTQRRDPLPISEGPDHMGQKAPSSISGVVDNVANPSGIDIPRVDSFILGLAGDTSGVINANPGTRSIVGETPRGHGFKKIGVADINKPIVDAGINPLKPSEPQSSGKATGFIPIGNARETSVFSNLGGFDIYGRRV